MLANRVSAFNYWRLVDPELKGFLTFKDFKYLLESVAFNVDKLSTKNVRNEFDVALNSLPNELNEDETANIFRFRLFEYLFLERCAIY